MCASFAPTGEKAQQRLIVYHGITSNQRQAGNLVQWRSSRQDIIAKSTCEAELIASSEVLQQGKNIAIVVGEVTNRSCEIEVSSGHGLAQSDFVQFHCVSALSSCQTILMSHLLTSNLVLNGSVRTVHTVPACTY